MVRNPSQAARLLTSSSTAQSYKWDNPRKVQSQKLKANLKYMYAGNYEWRDAMPYGMLGAYAVTKLATRKARRQSKRAHQAVRKLGLYLG
jgi:hypothetical protein